MIVAMLILLTASGFVLYSNFYTPAAMQNGRGFGQVETSVSGTSVKILDLQVTETSQDLEADGVWSKLETDSRYQRLSGEALVPITIGNYGHRANPFEPLELQTNER